MNNLLEQIYQPLEYHVFDKLNIDELANVCLVNKTFKKMVNHYVANNSRDFEEDNKTINNMYNVNLFVKIHKRYPDSDFSTRYVRNWELVFELPKHFLYNSKSIAKKIENKYKDSDEMYHKHHDFHEGGHYESYKCKCARGVPFIEYSLANKNFWDSKTRILRIHGLGRKYDDVYETRGSCWWSCGNINITLD